ncbi:MAG: right-handed parallel beta-helix repeat-containing protein [Sphingobacteriales bacterium]|nr:right-handed parallel beta-helix repeat-containing protein [Sphingobacteriales bacterium]
MNKKFYSIAIAFLISISTISASAQTKKLFSGIYTIGGSNANYQTIQKALTDLLAQNSEVIGRVTFNIRPGTYPENLVFKPYVGASAKNFVVFKSETGKASDVQIIDPGDNTLYNNQVIRFEGCSYYTLQDLTIQNSRVITASNQFASAIHFTYNRDTRKSAEFNTINRCVIKVDSVFTIFNGNTICIVASDINNTTIGDNCANYNTITNNTFYGGAFAIKLTGKSSAIPSKGYKISGNKFYKCLSGIDIKYHNIPLIASNTINCRPDPIGAQFGIRVQNAAGNFSFHSNVVKDFGTFGIFLYSVNGGAAAYVYNNMIMGNAKPAYSRGIHVENSSNIHFYHNSIHYTAPFNQDNACMVIENSPTLPATKMKVKNNIFYSTGGATSFILRSTASVDTMNFNDYFNATATSLAIIGGTSRSSLVTIKSSTAKNQNSLNVNPDFTSPYNLRIDSRKLIRKAYILPFIISDFENQPRDPEMPDIGADEVIRSAVDLEVFGLEKNFVPREGSNILPVVIKNDGLLSLNNNKILLSYRINNGSFTTPEEFTLQTLSKSYSKQTFILAAPWVIPSPGTYDLTIRVTPPVPNDTWQENDSIRLSICVGLNGTYTIGGPSNPKNYPTFAAALAAFDCGVGGPTTFNVYPGTYPGFSVPIVKGVSEVNTLTFRSNTGIASDVIIQNTTAAQTTTNHYVIQVDGADYITFKNFTLNNTSTSTFASGFHVTEGSNYVTLDSSIVTVPVSTASTQNKYPVVLSQKAKIDSGGVINNVYIKNCTLKNGTVGIQFFGRNTSIRSVNNGAINNTIDSSYLFGFYSTFMNVGEFSKNKITMLTASNAQSEAIRISFSKYNTIINGNKTYGASLRGINLTTVEGVTGITMANNMFGGGFKSTLNGVGVFLNEVNKLNMYHNSVYYDQNSTSTPNNSAAFFIASGSNVTLYNNIFYNSGNGYAFYVSSPTSIRASNNNIYYTDGNPSTNLYAYWNADRADMTTLKNSMQGFEINSLEINPLFVSKSDLHTSVLGLEGKGLYFESISGDYDGNARNPLGPDIGADEFIVNAKDLAVMDIQPLVFSTDPNTIKVKLMNLGSTSLNGSTVKLQFSSDGISWLPAGGETYTIGSGNSLAQPYASDIFTFATKFNATINNTYNFHVRILPSDRIIGDPVTKNDTAINIICTGLKEGTYTVGGTSPNYSDIASAVSAISCGVTGPVVFNIRPGTYSERFTINNPKNTSSINTITFKAENNDSSSVIISSNGTSGATNRNVVRLNRSKNIVLKYLTLRNMSNSVLGSAAVQITSDARNVSISNCRLLMSGTSSSPTLYVITTSDSANIALGGKGGNGVTIKNNYISGGNVGIAFKGASQYVRDEGLVIDGNIIDSSASFGISTANTDVASISGNKIIMRKEQSSSNGISVAINRTDTRILNNVIYNAATIGVSINDFIGINGILMANNTIGGNFKLGTDGAGVSLTKVFPLNMYYNSINYDGNSVFGSALKVDNDSRGIRILNNSLANPSVGFCFNITNFASIDTSDNNNFYTKGVLFARVNSLDYSSFEEYRDVTLTDEKTVAVDPDYFTSTNLHLTNTFLDGGAVVIPGLLTDMDGEVRNPEFPDIGADEFLVRGDIEVVSIDNPQPSPEVYPDLIPVTITVRNKGLSKISGLNVKFYVDDIEIANEVIPVEEPYKPLLPADLLTYNFTTQIEPTATGFYKLRVEAYLPDDIDTTNNAKEVIFKSSISSIVDGEVNAFVSPANSSVRGKTKITVLVKNAGTIPMKDFNMNFKVRGGTTVNLPHTQSFGSDSIMPLSVYAYSFEDSIECDPLYDRFLDVYITDLTDDINQINDTLYMYIKPFSGCFQGVEISIKDVMLTKPWPNPTSSTLNYDVNVQENATMKIELIDVLGHVLKSVDYDQMSQGINHLSVDVATLPPGIYYSKVYYNEQYYTDKIVISK